MHTLAAKFGLTAALIVTAGCALAQGAPPVPPFPPDMRLPSGARVPPGGVPAKPYTALPLSLPSTAPTAVPLPIQSAQPTQLPTATAPPATNGVHRARVEFANGLLTVHADNSSLNQILREIARVSNLQIAGGVTDERVYGTYGPSDLQTMLTTLLSGTGSNMMLSGDRPNDPQTLTLTPRQGGVTPPSPNATRDTNADPEADDLPPQLTPRTSNEPSRIPQQPVYPPQPQPFTAPSAQATTPANSGDTTAAPSSAGVKTPQQIYDELMKLQQQLPKSPQ